MMANKQQQGTAEDLVPSSSRPISGHIRWYERYDDQVLLSYHYAPTNNMLPLEERVRVREEDIYLPACFIFYLEEVKGLNYVQHRASCQGTLQFEIYYGNLEPFLVRQLLRMAFPNEQPEDEDQEIYVTHKSNPNQPYQYFKANRQKKYLTSLSFQNQRTVYLQESSTISVVHSQFYKTIKYVIYDQFDFKLKNQQLFWYPITGVEFDLRVTPKSIFMDMIGNNEFTSNRHFNIHFNLMYTLRGNVVVEEAELGKFKYSPVNSNHKFVQSYENSIKNYKYQGEVERSVQRGECALVPFQHAQITFLLYSVSFVYIIRILIRLKFLALLVIFNFFTSANLDGRLARLAFISVGVFGIMPSILAELPKASQLVLPEVLVYLQLFGIFLCLVQSYINRDKDYDQQPYSWQTDPFFLIVMILQILSIIISLAYYLIFKLYSEPRLLMESQSEKQMKQTDYKQSAQPGTFIYRRTHDQEHYTRIMAVDVQQEWYNDECHEYFMRYRSKVTVTEEKPVIAGLFESLDLPSK